VASFYNGHTGFGNQNQLILCYETKAKRRILFWLFASDEERNWAKAKYRSDPIPLFFAKCAIQMMDTAYYVYQKVQDRGGAAANSIAVRVEILLRRATQV